VRRPVGMLKELIANAPVWVRITAAATPEGGGTNLTRHLQSHGGFRNMLRACLEPSLLPNISFDTDAQVLWCAPRTRFVCAGQVRR
jgi:hypothetical protein